MSPNAADIVSIAHSVRESGADAISLVNTFQAISIDIYKRRPLFDNIKAGLSGPAIKPIALRMVYDVAKSFSALPANEQIPIIGLGGIQCWQDAIEFIMAGASAIQVGTATFSKPRTMIEIISGIQSFLQQQKLSLSDIKGCAL